MLREGYTLRIFEKRVLRKIFEPKRDELTGGWRELHNEELHNWYLPPIRMVNSRRMRWAGHAAQMEKRNAYILLVGQQEGKRSLGRPRCKWMEIIKMYLREIR
jgi:hypothetical protein